MGRPDAYSIEDLTETGKRFHKQKGFQGLVDGSASEFQFADAVARHAHEESARKAELAAKAVAEQEAKRKADEVAKQKADEKAVAHAERRDREKLYRPSKPWTCPKKTCRNVNSAGVFKCLSCGLDGLKMVRCLRKLKEKMWAPCNNKQPLLVLRCMKCNALLQHE
mmetsp:Transcript_45970/g.147795  ORF Transcript_45970/g.147795 Transcript_45970/m.147795 type:complete len:166 (+) Transcript_45970:317-814(+)